MGKYYYKESNIQSGEWGGGDRPAQFGPG
jgi:hypothetical protein